MREHGVALAATLAALVLLVVGCGGGSKAPSIASLGTTRAAARPTAAGSGDPALSARQHVGAELFSGVGLPAFAGCMRSHGVPDFPAPDSKGTVVLTASGSIDPNSPRFQAADRACGSLMPGPTPAQQAHERTQALSYSSCMRAHGLPDFPDPTFANGNVELGWRRSDRDSPVFQSAWKACHDDVPGLIQ